MIQSRMLKKQVLLEYKGGKCYDCKGVFPSPCMDFDHRDINTKSFNISARLFAPIMELMIEADKCDLVCANCHRIRTSNNPAISERLRIASTGKVHSQETRDKISLANSGKKFSPEHIAKLSIARKGVIPWNKGKKGLQVAWNKGKKTVNGDE